MAHSVCLWWFYGSQCMFSVKKRTSVVVSTTPSTWWLLWKSFTKKERQFAGRACRPPCRNSTANWRLYLHTVTVCVLYYLALTPVSLSKYKRS